MGTITRAARHLSVEEVSRRWKHDPRPHCRQRWLIIYQALVDPREAAQIAKHGGVSTTTVHHLISAYNRRGVAAVETPGKGGRRYQYLTLEQAQQFLAPFFAQAQVGTISTVAEIKQAFETQVGQEVAESTRLTLAPPSWLAQTGPAPGPPQGRSKPSKPDLKKLCRDRPSRGRHACPRRSATGVEDGGR